MLLQCSMAGLTVCQGAGTVNPLLTRLTGRPCSPLVVATLFARTNCQQHWCTTAFVGLSDR